MRLLGLLGAVLAWRDEHGRLLPYYLRPSQSWFDMHNLTNPGPQVTFNLTGAMELAARTPCNCAIARDLTRTPAGNHCVASRARCNVPPSFGCAIMHPAQKCTQPLQAIFRKLPHAVVPDEAVPFELAPDR